MKKDKTHLDLNEKMYITFCDSVKKIMKSVGISHLELSRKLNISPSSFSNKIHNAGGKFNLFQIISLSKELDESVEDLATGNIDITYYSF